MVNASSIVLLWRSISLLRIWDTPFKIVIIARMLRNALKWGMTLSTGSDRGRYSAGMYPPAAPNTSDKDTMLKRAETKTMWSWTNFFTGGSWSGGE